MDIMSEPPGPILKALRIAHYAYPPALFFYFLIAQTMSVCNMESLKAPQKRMRRGLVLWLQIAVIMSYVAEAILILARALIQKGWWSSEDNVIYVLSSILVWGVLELSLVDNTKPVWYPYYGAWFITLITEACLIAVSGYYHHSVNPFHYAKFVIEGVRVSTLVLLPLFFWGFQTKDNGKNMHRDEESTGLLSQGVNSNESGNSTEYGSIGQAEDGGEGTEANEAKAKMLKKLEASGNWWNYAKSFAVFWPYIWPSKDRWLQLNMALVGVCLLAQRGLNLMVPVQLGRVTDQLAHGGGTVPWLQVSLYVFYRWLNSGSGVAALQTYLWMPIDQYSYRTITTAAYNHVMSLSHDFHANKKTGDLYTSVNQGRSVNGFIESILFAVLPMLADLCVAFAYFYILFNAYMALIVAVVSVVYLWVTAKMGNMRNEMRREFNQTARKEANVMWETMSSWTTVSYFNRIAHEQNRYSGAVRNFQRAERNWNVGLSVLSVAQSLIFTVGLLGASFLAVYQVSIGRQPVGSFVTLLSYWAQLSSPLSFFANFYRKIQNQMLDAERLLELFQTKPTVVDKTDAKELEDVKGEVIFDAVQFSYDPRKPAINSVSFRAPAGSTVAFVGETGGGKTTCLKLLFRFYDVQSGSIKIDGHDIRDLSLWSLREKMGVVPQDPELFNDTIMNNIKYANFDATDEQVYNACRAAAIHEKITSFPDGYLSKVGERGVRLSGGELQRVSIARAILKNPKIILLDEATSMVDMETERHIQAAFKELSKDRTMFVVAHRLSTIMNADIIIVIKDGAILENGSHDELLELKGKYYQLWSKQMKNEGPRPAPDPKDLTMVNDLSPKSREEELKKALKKTGARFHGVEQNKPEENKGSTQQSIPAIIQPAEGGSNVTFVHGDGNSFKKFQLPHNHHSVNTRGPGPTPGILKHVDASGRYEKQQTAPMLNSKGQSILKPDAREFVPNSVITVQQQTFTSIDQSSSSVSKAQEYSSFSRSAPASANFLSMKEDKQAKKGSEGAEKEPKQDERECNPAQDPPKIDKNKARELGKRIDGNQLKNIDKGRKEILETKEKMLSEDIKDQEQAIYDESPQTVETEAQAEVKKKRRRCRRRSNKSGKSGDETADSTSPVPLLELTTTISPLQPLSPMKTISPRPMDVEDVANTDAEAINANKAAALVKKRHRFRNSSNLRGAKGGPEPENEEPLTIFSSVQSAEGLKQKNSVKQKAQIFGESNSRSASKEIVRPASKDGPVPPRKSESAVSINSASNKLSFREPIRRRGSGRSVASLGGSWRRSDKVEAGDVPTNSHNKAVGDGPSNT